MLTITDIQVKSATAYSVASDLQLRSPIYRDRPYVATSVPDPIRGADYIQTANSDKNIKAEPFLRFTVNVPVTVYVAHDVRITPKPIWLSLWADTSQDLVTSDTTLHLYTKAFEVGVVTLGINGWVKMGSMYAVIVKPAFVPPVVPEPDHEWVRRTIEPGLDEMTHQTDMNNPKTKVVVTLDRRRVK